MINSVQCDIIECVLIVAVTSCFWWELPWGEVICKSLIDFRDSKLDMIIPEDSGIAYEVVCSELGYDTVGVPKSDEDAKRFADYRDSSDLGSVIDVSNCVCISFCH